MCRWCCLERMLFCRWTSARSLMFESDGSRLSKFYESESTGETIQKTSDSLEGLESPESSGPATGQQWKCNHA